jgi:hypothetical protein
MQLTRDEVEMLSAWREQAVYLVGCLCLRLCLHVVSVPVCLCAPRGRSLSTAQRRLSCLDRGLGAVLERRQGASSPASCPRLCTRRSWPRASRPCLAAGALLGDAGAHCSGARRLWR